MKLRALLREYLRLGAIIGALPNTIANGQAVDATPVMADFNFIVSQVNANAAAATTVSSLQTTVNGYGARASFTPAIAFGGAAVGVTYNPSGQTGYYSVVQNFAFVSGAVWVSAKGSSVGVLTITGLPVSANLAWPGTVNNWGYPVALMVGNITMPGSAAANYPIGMVAPGTGTMYILGMSSGAYPSNFNQLDCAAAFTVQFMGTYPIS